MTPPPNAGQKRSIRFLQALGPGLVQGVFFGVPKAGFLRLRHLARFFHYQKLGVPPALGQVAGLGPGLSDQRVQGVFWVTKTGSLASDI